ncbi:LysR family transcriptional regulator [Vibrio sp. WXL103]|uniref:LysR family transcriptional regulator n=1 Tax=Vibrio sp. WXL103 TaxID=3450710 RepID=UPI003EC7DA5C
MDFDLNLIRHFLTIYRHKSYTRAAEELDLSQPSMSRAIQRLEKVLGEKLFIKSGRGIEPTHAADLFARKMMSVETLIIEALAAKESAKIYCNEGMTFGLKNFAGEIEIPPIEQTRMLEDIRLEKVDLAIDYVTEKHPSLIVEELTCLKMVVVAAGDNPIEELDEETFYQAPHVIVTSHRHGINFFDLLADNPKKRQVKFRAPSIMTMLTYVSRDKHALGFTSESLAKDWQEQLNLKIFDSPVPVANIPLQMIYLRKNHKNMRNRQLRETIKNTFLTN